MATQHSKIENHVHTSWITIYYYTQIQEIENMMNIIIKSMNVLVKLSNKFDPEYISLLKTDSINKLSRHAVYNYHK